MAKIVCYYVCSECGRVEEHYQDKCPQCGKSKTLEKSILQNTGSEKTIKREMRAYPSLNNIPSIPLKKLSDVQVIESIRFKTGLSEFDRVLGGGVMKGSSVLLGGEPGIGKSTLLLQTISNLSSDHSVIYISGEETDSQVKHRAERLGLNCDKINIFSSTKLASIVDLLWRERPDVIVVDSLQTLSTSDIDTSAGTGSQIKACTAAITETIKLLGITMFIVAHVTKDGSIAGPKFAEHLVDTVLYFESAEGLLRVIRASKNRYGSSDEIGVFVMGEHGLSCIDDPSTSFAVPKRQGSIPPGIVNTAVIEGSRALFVELQVLCTPSKGQNRRVYSDKIDSSLVQRVVAILENKTNINLGFSDIYVNVAGGIHLIDPAIELPLAVAIYTSYSNIEINKKVVYYGELTLIGEVRCPSFISKRNKIALSMGYNIGVYQGNEEEREINVLNISTLGMLENVIKELAKGSDESYSKVFDPKP